MTLNPCIDVNGVYAERTALSRPIQSIEYQATSGGAWVTRSV